MSEDRAELLLSLLNHAQRPIKDALLAKLMFLPSPQNLAEWHRCNSSTVCHEGLKKELRLIVTLAQNAHTIEHLAAHFIEATPAIQSPSAKDLPTKRVLLGPKFLCYFGHAPTSASYQDIFLSMVHTPTFSAGWLCASEQVSFE
jgi:hypothetical protein